MDITESLLSQNEEIALAGFLSRVQESLGETFNQAILFGSKSRGDGESDSDIDILILVTDENWDVRDQISLAASCESLDNDVLISPTVIGEIRWQQMTGFNLYKNVRQDGLTIKKKADSIQLLPLAS